LSLAPLALLAVALLGQAGEPSSTTAPETIRARRAEHLTQIGAEQWHRLGHRGRGVKVAILDTGFRGYRDHLGRSLPDQVVARSFREDGNLEARDSQHGILCGEVVHALAPDAQLLFANWEHDDPASFLAAVRWARQEGARVISCSVIMPGWSDGEGGGKVHEALSAILGPGDSSTGVLFFACAGNTAKRHWSGPFQDDGAGCHLWKPGERSNRLTPTGTERVSVELTWKAGPDYHLAVYDADSGKEVASSPARRDEARCSAAARFEPEPRHRYLFRVRLAHGPAGAFHCVILGGGLEHTSARGSIVFPADGPEVVAVGAVDTAGRRLVYSSCGPNSASPKPDLVASVPFPSLWRTKPFAGTSAAAPQAAALAALWLSRQPDWSADRIRQVLRRNALHPGETGHSFETGYGLIRLPKE
jgi:subtilisin family serine protease